MTIGYRDFGKFIDRGALVIVGAGGHGRVCSDIAIASGWSIAGYCDNVHPIGELTNGVAVIAADLDSLHEQCGAASVQLFVAIGDNAARERISQQASAKGFELATLMHPSAIVSLSAEIATGTVLMPGAIINSNARIGRWCIINTAASVDHDCHLGDGSQIGPGARLAGHVSLGAGAFVGTGAVLTPRVRVGARAMVGAGSVVVRDVADGVRVAGVPAKPLAKAIG